MSNFHTGLEVQSSEVLRSRLQRWVPRILNPEPSGFRVWGSVFWGQQHQVSISSRVMH